MARVPEAELGRLKREVDLVALVEASGVELRRQGKDWAGLCPWHDDKEPSLVVSPETEPPLWHCLGACATGGTAIDWVMKAERLGFREAVARLQQLVGGVPIVEPEPATSPTADEASPASLVLDAWMDDRRLWDATVGYYREALGRRREPRAYLERRGLGAPAMLECFEVGYCDRTLNHHMPARHTKPGQRFRARLIELGIMRQGSGQEHMSGRVVVPVRDESGLVVGMYGRTTHTRLHGDVTPSHLYLPGPRRGVLNWRALLEHKEVILCEAPFDAMTFWAAGFENVTSAWGASGFGAEHLEAFRRHGVARVLIAYDRDEAGDAGAAKVAGELLADGIECFRVLFPRGMDANAYACKVAPAEKSLGLVIRQAQWMGKGKPPATSTVLLAATSPPPVEVGEEAEAAKEEERLPAEPVTLGELAARAAAEEERASSLAAHAAAGPTSPAASPSPAAPEIPVEIRGEEVVLWLGDRRYRVRGLAKNLSYELLKVNLLASRGDVFHVDTFDLYSARARLGFAKLAAAELGIAEDVARSDVNRVLLRLELLQQELIERELATAAETPAMSAAEREEALAYLRDPELVAKLAGDFHACGVVGEESNALVGYLAATSRKLEAPLAVLIQSSSAAGKSALLEAILAMMPPEERVKYSAMTGQSLFYMSEQDLRHKILALVEEEGAQRASYALKLLQSEGELTIASTGKDPHTGRLVTHEYRVEGPVAILLTTTAVDIDEELLNRCLVLTVDEEREQTRAIHRHQRESWTLEGFVRKDRREAILERQRNVQRLLEPLPVLNPFAPTLEFLDTQVRTRRDHQKYLALIASIALLHQYQRRRVTVETARRGPVECVEVAIADVALANRLANEVLGRTLDELPPQTRRLLSLVDGMVGAACAELAIDRSDLRFTLRQVREATGWGQTQLRLHLGRLIDLEYVVVHRGGRGQTFVYELVYDGGGEDGRPFLPKLIDVEALESHGQRPNLSGSETHLSESVENRSGSNRPQIGPKSGGSRVEDSSVNPSSNGRKRKGAQKPVENSAFDPQEKLPLTVAAGP